MSISNDEISNFTFIESISSEKGTIKTFFNSFKLKKVLVDFEVFTKVVYSFDPVNGWGLQDVYFSPIISDVSLAGTKWAGTFQHPAGMGTDERITMEITSLSSLSNINGSIEVTMNLFTTTDIGIGKDKIMVGEWSQIAKGYINFVDLSFEILFDKWIVPPPVPRFHTEAPNGLSFSGKINLESSSISGNRMGGISMNSFNMTLTDDIIDIVQSVIENDNDDD